MIYEYGVRQCIGYMLQIIPIVFLLYAPHSQENMRFPKKKMIGLLTTGYLLLSTGAGIFLARLFASDVTGNTLRGIGNLIFGVDLLIGTILYFISLKKNVKGKILFYMLIFQYGIVMYSISEIGTKFFNKVLEKGDNPYSRNALIIYSISTAATFPFMYWFVNNKNIQEAVKVDKKKLNFVTYCSFFILLLTFVSLQMEIGLNGLVSSKRAKIYEGIWLSCSLISNLILYVIYFGCLFLEKEKEKIHSRLTAYEFQYENMRSKMEKERRRNHNLRHHFRTLSTMAKNGQNEELQKYISDYLGDMDEMENRKISVNPIINDVLSYYVAQAENSKIRTEFKIQVKETYPFNIRDMTVLLGNAMENSLKSCEECQELDPYISVKICQYKKSILIKIENSIHPQKKSMQKKDKGYGLESIDMIAKKYEGSMEAWQEEDRFILRVVLNISDLDEKGEKE